MGLVLFASAPVVKADDTAVDKVVTVAVGASIPPYINSETQSGLERELIAAALAEQGLRLELKLVSGHGARNNFIMQRVDAVLLNRATPSPDSWMAEGYPSADISNYHNHAITLSSAEHRINSIESLAAFRVAAFFNASQLLDKRFAQTVNRSPLYRETPDQSDQVLALYRGLVDVVVADPFIFSHFQGDLRQSHGLFRDVEFHNIFALSPRHILFTDPGLRDQFNAGLQALKRSGRYRQIVESFTDNETFLTRF